MDDESFQMGGARRPACAGPAGHGIGIGEGRAGERSPDVHRERRPDEPEGATWTSSRTSRRRSRCMPGDTVVFHWAGIGEPHTATLGTLADSAVQQFNSLPAASRQANRPPPPAMQALDATVPSLFPQGPGDATQSVANPCYQRSRAGGHGRLPELAARAARLRRDAPTTTAAGSTRARSGPSISRAASSPGTYRFMCALHREEMQGKITVAPASKTIMSPAAQFALGAEAVREGGRAARSPARRSAPGAAAVPHVTLPGAEPGARRLGRAELERRRSTSSGLQTVKIPVGGSVTWWLLGAALDHVQLRQDERRHPRGSAGRHRARRTRRRSRRRAGRASRRPRTAGRSQGIHFKLVASSSWNGAGLPQLGRLHNSFGPPVIEGYKLTFTKAGTYHYLCTVHDHMKGTVVVG